MFEVSDWMWLAFSILFTSLVGGIIHLSAKLDTVMRQLEAVLKATRPDLN